MSTNHQSLGKQYATANRACAAIILADVEKFGGEEAAMVQWARLVLALPAEREEPAPEFELVP